MTPLRHAAMKELGAIGPIWLACCLGAAAVPLWRGTALEVVSAMAYVLGSVVIGAHVLGHEYAHRTMGTLLVQPVRRTTTLGVKLGVLMAALLTLAAIAAAGPGSPIQRFPSQATLDSRVVYLPTLMGLTLAPYLALVTRGTLGGAVFSIAIPGLLLVAADVIGLAIYGAAMPGEIDRFKYAVFPSATIAACAFAAVALWRRFIMLEVPGDDGGHVSVAMRPRAARDSVSRRPRNPYALLVSKELHLQQMTIVVILLYVLGWAAGAWSQRSATTAVLLPWWQLNILFAALLALLIGSLASAEERQLRTLEWQTLLPMASWKQFAVKVAIVCGLALLAGIGLPILLAQFTALPHLRGFPRGSVLLLSLTTVAIAIGSLYVSTLSASGARAVATAAPAIAATVVVIRGVQILLSQAAGAGVIPEHLLTPWRVRSGGDVQTGLAILLLGAVAVVLAFAYRNHCSGDRNPRRVARQAASLVTIAGTTGVLLFVLGH